MKDFKSLGIGSLYEKKKLVLNELQTSLMFIFAKHPKFVFDMMCKVADIW